MADFPSLQTYDPKNKPSKMIVFIVGGATYEEAKELSVTYNTDESKVILGGTTVHNSKTFIADVAQLMFGKGGKGML